MPVNFPAPLGPNLFILGEPVLSRYYTVYDWERPQIGFGLAASRQNIAAAEGGADIVADMDSDEAPAGVRPCGQQGFPQKSNS